MFQSVGLSIVTSLLEVRFSHIVALFAAGLARFLNGTTDEKIQILFKLYDLSGTNAISYEDLTTILYSLISMPYIVPGVFSAKSKTQQAYPLGRTNHVTVS